MKKQSLKTLVAVISGVLLVALAFAGCQRPQDPPAVSDGDVARYVTSYDELYDICYEANQSSNSAGRSSLFVEDLQEAPMEMAQEEGAKSDAPSAPEYSETNVQVEGVDEGDIVKTDGRYIYILRQGELLIAEAKGEETNILSKTDVCKVDSETEDDVASAGSFEEGVELYIYDHYVVVLTYRGGWATPLARDAVSTQEQSVSNLYIYDVSDPKTPALDHELGQDGYNLTSRLIDGTLYLISSYHVYEPDKKEQNTYVPSLYRDGESSFVAEECIAVMPVVPSTVYTVVSAYDVASGELGANQTILGGGETVYMNHENLYIANDLYDETESEPYRDGQYTVVDYTGESKTELVRFDIRDGNLELAASAVVPGHLNDQFSLDEHEGYLRMVVTEDQNQWSIYTDEKHGWSNYDYENGESGSSNGLHILDDDLKIVGSVTDLAPDEAVYSSRFDGDIGYFVTFRQVDPLFAVDLSDPENPQVLSALKIPGFSEYLHVYGEDRLFGLGMDADEETGITSGMKLTMFDTSDPAKVTEKHTLVLDTSYSVALANHKAILISPEKDLIAFPADDGYDIYGYSDERGFYQKGHMDGGDWAYDARAVYIEELLYVITEESLSVFNLDSLEQVTSVALE